MTNGFVRAALFGTIAVLATTSFAEASQTDGRNQFVTIANKTDTAIVHLYGSFSSDSNWGSDRLPSPLLPGEYFYIDTREAWDECTYDIRAVFADGTEARFMNEDVCFQDNFHFVN